MADFREISQLKVADPHLAAQLHRATTTSMTKRDALVAQMPHWNDLREHARQIRRHTLSRLDHYLRQFVDAAERSGAHVSWAVTGSDACRQIVDLACARGVTRVVKAKTMTGEEIEINRALEGAGIEPIETDFGEWICQLADEPPSHVTSPIIHWSLQEVAALLRKRGFVDRDPPSDSDLPDNAARLSAAAELMAAARRALHERFTTAQMGISGANFAVAETGSLVIVENEANIRLSTTCPPLHVAIVGIDKLIPSLDDLPTFLTLLPVSATGQRQTAYVSLLHRPFDELHIILLDNGRSRLLADPQHFDLLTCIRCGACQNVCPVYCHVSGHAYNAPYQGPIGAALMPHLRPDPFYQQLPYASSLCGACSEVCPVAIPLDQRLLEWRARIVEDQNRSRAAAGAFTAWAWLMRHPRVYRSMRRSAPLLNNLAPMLGLARDWNQTRDLPRLAGESFAQWWAADHETGDRNRD